MKKKESKPKRKKESKPKRFDPVSPNKDIVDMAINQDDGIKRVTSVKYQIFESMKEGQEYVASKVGKIFHISRRRALEKMDELEEEGLLQSTYDLLRFEKKDGSFSVSKTRIFSKN